MQNYFDEFMKVYFMLEDEESKDIFISRLDYLITGDFKYIRGMIAKYMPELIPWHGWFGYGFRIEPWLMRLPDRKFVLYGAGKEGARWTRLVKEDPRFLGFVSKNTVKQRNGYMGYPVMAPEELLRRRDVSVIISTSKARNEIREILRQGGYPDEMIFDSPTAAMDSAQQSEDELKYYTPNFMKFEDEEILVDAGSYDLGSAIELTKYCKHVSKVYAFEPDPVSFERCVRRKEEAGLTQAVILPYATWSERATLHFDSTGDGESQMNVDGDESIQAVPIDAIVDEMDKVTTIKMDVEGAELESLKGASKTIQRCRPKLAISMYHKPEDMLDLPMYIKSLVPEYNLYIRHHSSSQNETVLYAIIPPLPSGDFS